MLSDAHLIAFVPPVLAWSTRLDRSRAFYVGVLGLQEQSTTPYACVLSAAGVQLRITLVGELRPQPFTVLGWQVADGIWTTPGGDRVAWFHDPDGNTLSVTEFRG